MVSEAHVTASPRLAAAPASPADPGMADVSDVTIGDSPAESFSGDPRKYVSHACEACRFRRSKCDGKLPTCSTCKKRRTGCTYSEIDRRRGKLKKHETDALLQQVRSLQDIISTLQIASDEDAQALLKKIRRDQTELIDSVSLFDGPSPVSETLADYRQSQERDLKPAVDIHVPASHIYTPENLPPEGLIKHTLETYLNCCSTLFYILHEQDVNDILKRMYVSKDPVDTATLGEVCAVAAIGSHYDPDNVPLSVMEALYRTASVYMHDCIENDFLRGMRTLLCLSMYSFMTKRSSARLSIASGLQIARWVRLHRQVASDDWQLWRRVYRTLVFMECWLSSSLGYRWNLSDEEVKFTQLEIVEPVPTLDNAIQAQMSAVGILLANILKDVYRSSSVVFSIVRKHSTILEDWRRSLPAPMQLSSILDPGFSGGAGLEERHRRSLMLVHIMGFGAQILLQRRLLVAMADCEMNKRWTLDGSREEGASIRQECVAAAKSCVQLFDCLGYTTASMFRRCWLCIGHAFSVSSVLLFEAAHNLLYGVSNGVDELLTQCQKCIDVLQGCSLADRVARTMLDIVLPLHQDLQGLANADSKQNRQSGIYNLLQNPHSVPLSFQKPHSDNHGSDSIMAESDSNTAPRIRAAAIPAMQKAIDVLGNPFGHPRRLNIESFSPGDPDVPSWWN
ncbi:hypothetical protein A1O1_02327 [Capronia coronata CBS 617.96]|uniref:Zn(2)-C6 fungal-type domain-containing protein n=1 Tax=Capronia coronata CBS 617.96 TaxID=1182541 RepID=W9ZHI1_9EURO|nr:uncharacterized protein A1O1_02327 [Capronia coronata CBS 617.96]EXJ93934.1 hypothetical protein A1O1_02327 [Capronia coronata CBS 617.96]